MIIGVAVFVFLVGCFAVLNYTNIFSVTYDSIIDKVEPVVEAKKVLDFKDYDERMLRLAMASSTVTAQSLIDAEILKSGLATSSGSTTAVTSSSNPPLWPAKAVYPNVDAILPFKRVIAYYGNFLSTKMGVLGEYPADEMLAMLRAEVAKWEEADPTTPVMPAIDYIAVTAQKSPGTAGKYRLRMPDEQIDRALDLAKQVNGIVILEIQAGLSDIASEIVALEKYFKMPEVHLALDPEFYMKSGDAPGTVIGSMDAVEINYAANYLAELVRANNLPPKILIVHRFTHAMVTNSKNIKPLPEVQIVMDMDGWGSPERKYTTYSKVVAAEPVQFTGYKLFYKNDTFPPSSGMVTPQEILKLKPRPIFIQYQ